MDIPCFHLAHLQWNKMLRSSSPGLSSRKKLNMAEFHKASTGGGDDPS